jgi:hypothetical protein
MRSALTVTVLILGSLSAPWLGTDNTTFADEAHPDLTAASNRKVARNTDLTRQVKGLLSHTRAGKVIEQGGVVLDYVLYGTKWSNTNISVSFMPDGAMFDGEASALFSLLDQRASRDEWQRQFARSLACWAAVSPLNFRIVADYGAAHNAVGKVQADPNFGDIRITAKTLNASYAGQSHYPSTLSTGGGDAMLNTLKTYNIGSNIDIYTLILHEFGHSIGLGKRAAKRHQLRIGERRPGRHHRLDRGRPGGHQLAPTPRVTAGTFNRRPRAPIGRAPPSTLDRDPIGAAGRALGEQCSLVFGSRDPLPTTAEHRSRPRMLGAADRGVTAAG